MNDLDGYSCFLQGSSATQTIAYPVSISTSSNNASTRSSLLFSSPVLLYCVSTVSASSPPQSGTAVISFFGANSTVLQSIMTPGSVENTVFTQNVANAIAVVAGLSNSSVLVYISFDANNNPQLDITFLPGPNGEVPSSCGFSGNIQVPVSIYNVTITVFIGPFRSDLNSWLLSQVSSIAALPLYVTIPVAIAVSLLFLALLIIYHTRFPKTKMTPILGVFAGIPGFSTNILFLSYLNSARVSSPSARTICAPVMQTVNLVESISTILLCIGVFCLIACAVFGWIQSARLLLPSCHNKVVSTSFSAKDLISLSATQQFETWKKRHNFAILFVIFLCGLSPSHLFILHSRLGGLDVFNCPFPRKMIRFVKLLSLVPLLLVYIPFAALQIASSVIISGWTSQVLASLIVTCVQIAFSLTTFFISYFMDRFSCTSKLCKKNIASNQKSLSKEEAAHSSSDENKEVERNNTTAQTKLSLSGSAGVGSDLLSPLRRLKTLLSMQSEANLLSKEEQVQKTVTLTL
jgi:hypothetical protein